MKIGIDIRAIGRKRTGDETYTLQLVRNLAKLDHENSYFLYTDVAKYSDLEKIEEKMQILNKNFWLKSVLPDFKAFWTFLSLPRQAKKDKLDLLHVQHISPLTLDRKIKLVTTIHDLSFERYPQHINFGDRFLLKLLIPPSIRFADGVIAVSEFTKKEIVKLYKQDPKHISAINNGGAESDFFRESGADLKIQLKKFLGFDDPYILYLGTLQPRKNISTLLDGFEQLITKNQNQHKISNLRLVIVGAKNGPNYDQKIDESIKQITFKNKEIAKRIIFPGYIERKLLPTIYQQAKLFCFPSLYEGFGLPMIEAMAARTPVVASKSSCLPEIGGSAALLFDPLDKIELAKCMKRVILDDQLSKQMRMKGLEIARKYNWENCARQTLDLYEKVAYSI